MTEKQVIRNHFLPEDEKIQAARIAYWQAADQVALTILTGCSQEAAAGLEPKNEVVSDNKETPDAGKIRLPDNGPSMEVRLRALAFIRRYMEEMKSRCQSRL